jgi:hypothetical protein
MKDHKHCLTKGLLLMMIIFASIVWVAVCGGDEINQMIGGTL